MISFSQMSKQGSCEEKGGRAVTRWVTSAPQPLLFAPRPAAAQTERARRGACHRQTQGHIV